MSSESYPADAQQAQGPFEAEDWVYIGNRVGCGEGAPGLGEDARLGSCPCAHQPSGLGEAEAAWGGWLLRVWAESQAGPCGGSSLRNSPAQHCSPGQLPLAAETKPRELIL